MRMVQIAFVRTPFFRYARQRLKNIPLELRGRVAECLHVAMVCGIADSGLGRAAAFGHESFPYLVFLLAAEERTHGEADREQSRNGNTDCSGPTSHSFQQVRY